jgi:hypothetical protein
MTEQKIEAFWRDATAADVARVMAGETVEARFRDIALRDWKFGHLNGWADGEFRCDLAMCWKHCQVYDPPEWYTNKPDPGEGWRLLEKFPPENVKPGDCFYGCGSIWVEEMHHVTVQAETIWYRRRIEPNVPEIPDSCERKKLEAGKEYLLPSGLVLIVHNESIEVKHD